jgi:hypothetical protein
MDGVRTALCIATIAALLGVAAGASATDVYGLKMTAPMHVHSATQFKATVTGAAPKRSVLNLFVDRRACAAGAQQESSRYASVNAHPGDSYFISPEGTRVTFYSQPVKGSFTRYPLVHAGTTRETEHLCAYLNVLDAPSPASIVHVTATFIVL